MRCRASLEHAEHLEGDLFLGLNLRAGNSDQPAQYLAGMIFKKVGYPMEGMIKMNHLTGFDGWKKYETG